MITIYRYEGQGASYDRIPARDLTVAEFRTAIAGRNKAERKLIYSLYTRTRVAEPAPAPVIDLEAPADPPAAPVAPIDTDGTEEDDDDGTTDRP
jgi:hypothetical protein